ncbi:unnamed protein product [Darwinula stevensoni]|uniref:TOG domain-containing protein n=1 Tax=Darwinula stevensoni TaxID=69355 RepID=A0A7R9A039_9CRUS|nr:unnamed protein product [Darwinula stevensoni]CAG0884793.1 unnamed protein product [Darwinula stevensoni]
MNSFHIPDEGAEGDEVVAIDPHELLDPVEILSKLPKDFYEKCEEPKWKDRKEALDGLQPLVSNPKLAVGDYGELVKQLKKMVQKDSNVVVVAQATQCLTGLANGLKKKFYPYAASCIPVFLEKFKEKKQNVVTALREAIDAVSQTTSMEALQEDVLAALENKNPAVKAETSAFLARSFAICSPAVLTKKLLKGYCASLLKALNDSDATVRENAAQALGTLLKAGGEKLVMPFLTDVDNIKMGKIKEYCDKAEVKAPTSKPKARSRGGEAEATEPAPKSNTNKGPVIKKPTPKASRPSTVPAKAPAKKAPPGAKPISGGAKAESKESVVTEKEMSLEEAEEMCAELLGPQLITEMVDTNWKVRLSALEQFLNVINSSEGSKLPCQALVRILSKKPGLKDNNLQVLKLRFDALKIMAEKCKFTKVSGDCVLVDLIDKLGDPKTGSSASAALNAVAEAITFAYVGMQALTYAFSQKNPKVQADTLTWLSEAIKEFGFLLPAKTVIDSVKQALAATNKGVRDASITLLGTIYLYMGKKVRVFFEDEKPVLLQLIDAEFEKVLILLIWIEVWHNMLYILNLVRSEALDKVASIISSAKFVTANLNDLPSALKARVVDSNRNLAAQALTICKNLAEALGPYCKQHVRSLIPGVLQALGDNKSNIRSAALETLNSWLEHSPMEAFWEGEMMADALKTENPYVRAELLKWIAEKIPDVKKLPKDEVSACIPHLYTCLEDRNPDVRKNAQDAILPFMIHFGFEPMMRATGKLKPTSKATVSALLEKARPNLPVQTQAQPASKGKTGGTRPVSSTSTGEDSGKKPLSAGAKTTKAIKGGKPAVPASARTTRKKEEDVDTSPLLAVSTLKNQRILDEQKLKVLRWNFTTPREEFVDLLRDQMITANFNRSLIAQLLHNDFKFHIKAIEALEADRQNVEAVMANLDLILKWMTLRFFETNPSVILRGLDYLQGVFSSLADHNYHMLDAEANCFIPYLILKASPALIQKSMGDPKDAVRSSVRGIMKTISHIYPSTKIFPHVMEGTKSKNARQRAECLDHMGHMISTCRLTVCQPTPQAALKEIAKQIADRDNSVRNAALNCIVQVYYQEGERVYKLVGNLSDKEMSLLEERLKRASKNAPPVQPKTDVPLSNPGNDLPAVRSASQSRISPHAAQNGVTENHATVTRRSSSAKKGARPISTRFALDLSSDEDAPEKIERPQLMQVELEEEEDHIFLPKRKTLPTSPSKQALSASADAIQAVELVVSQIPSPNLTTSLKAIAQIIEVIKHEQEHQTLKPLVGQLVILMNLKMKLTYESCSSSDSNKEEIMRIFRNLLLLCLTAHPVVSLKSETAVMGDMPLRTIRTVLHSLVKLKSKASLQLIQENPEYSESYLAADTKRYYGAIMKEREKEGDRMMTKIPKSAHEKLTEIFTKIGNKEETKEGLVMLFEFKQQYPETDLSPFLNKSSQFFKRYVEQHLAKIEAERASTTTAPLHSSVPQSCPATDGQAEVGKIDLDRYMRTLQSFRARMGLEPANSMTNSDPSPEDKKQRENFSMDISPSSTENHPPQSSPISSSPGSKPVFF